MELEKKHYIQIAICVLLSIVSIAIYVWYYNEYIKPKSYVIGSPSVPLAYESLPIKEYLSSENVLFSLDINDVSFKNIEGTATYEYVFDGVKFNGLENDYAMFVNNTLLEDTQNAGTLSGVHHLQYIDVYNSVFETTDININFAFGNLECIFFIIDDQISPAGF